MSEARLVAQLALGVVFLASTVGKLRRPASFIRGVADYDLLPRPIALALGALLIPVEGFVALTHLGGFALATATPLAIGLLVIFAVAVTVSLRRERELPCFCFSSDGSELISGRTVARVLGLLAGALFVASAPGFLDGPWPRAWYTGRTIDEIVALVLWTGLALIVSLWLVHAGAFYDLWLKRARCESCESPNAATAQESS